MALRPQKFTHIATNTTTIVLATQARLERVVINKKGTTANIATVYNGPAASADVVAVIDTTSELKHLDYGCECPDGLYIVTATGVPADLTIIWS